jgi:hypothetical protein
MKFKLSRGKTQTFVSAAESDAQTFAAFAPSLRPLRLWFGLSNREERSVGAKAAKKKRDENSSSSRSSQS